MSSVADSTTFAVASSTYGSGLVTLISDVLTAATSTQQSTTKTKTRIYVPAGDSGVPPSSSSSSASPQYKTVYVTKTAQPNSNAGSSNLQSGAIAGIAVGGVVFLALLVGLIYFVLRRRHKTVLEPADVPRSSGSQTTFVAEKDGANVSELHGSQHQPVYEASSKVVYEMEASMPELEGKTPELEGRSFSLESEQSPTTPTMAQSRHIMSRGRPIRGKKG